MDIKNFRIPKFSSKDRYNFLIGLISFYQYFQQKQNRYLDPDQAKKRTKYNFLITTIYNTDSYSCWPRLLNILNS